MMGIINNYSNNINKRINIIIIMEKFISINEWLNESSENQQEERSSFGCVMLDAKIPDWHSLHINGIDKRDVYIKPLDESYGLEDNPHMTLLYGIHEDEIDPEVIMDVIREDLDIVTVDVTNISIFENEEYDVVKYDIPVTKEIQKYRDLLESTFANTQSYPDFHPHMTIAYVKPGEGSKYVKELDEPFSVTFNKGVYSFHEKNEEGEEEMLTKEHVFPDPDKLVVDLEVEETEGMEVSSPFTSDNE